MTKKQLVLFTTKSLQNAQELIEDGLVLFKEERIPRAYTMFQLGLEETGKSVACLNYLIFADLKDMKGMQEFKRFLFRDHQWKTTKSIGMEILFAIFQFEDYKKAILHIDELIEENEDVYLLNDMKNYSLYTSLINNQCKTPGELITAKDVGAIAIKSMRRVHAAELYISQTLPNIDELRNYIRQPDFVLPSKEKLAMEFFKEIGMPNQELEKVFGSVSI
jgi:AbiV family abortive infection protein